MISIDPIPEMFASEVSSAYEIARKYDNRAGFSLISCQDVGLPIYRITIQAITQVKKKIPPIEEFILKAIDAGLTQESHIGSFLGLEPLIIRDAMVSLRMKELIDLIGSDGEAIQEWIVTKPLGQSTLKDAKSIVPEERTFVITFDGLLRKVKWHGRFESYLLKSKDLKAYNYIEISPSKTDPPVLSDLDIRDVDTFIKEAESLSRFKRPEDRDLLAVKSIERRELNFLPALALVFKSIQNNDIEVTFVVDKRINSDYEKAFALSNSTRRFHILEDLKEGDPRTLVNKVLGKEYVDQLPLQHIEDLQRKVTSSQTKAFAVKEQLADSDNDEEKKNLQAELDQALSKIVELEQELNKLPFNWLQVYDHPPLLAKALDHTENRLLIVSPWIRANVVNKNFLKRLDILLKKGCDVYIGYGLGETKSDKREWDVDAEKKLQNLANKYKNFRFRRLGDTHAKILISDNKIAANSSFNWLSFKGDPNRTFRDERGSIIYFSPKIDELFESYMYAFE